jgi:hypothetical protein
VPPHDQPTSPTASTAVGAGADVDRAAAAEDPRIVAWHRTGRRLRRQLVVIAGLVVVAWLVLAVRAGGPSLRSLAELTGLGVLLAVAAEIVVVGGAALRGLLAAGERGDRLASADVSLLPPQVSRRLRNRRR